MESFATILGVAVILGGVIFALGYIFERIKKERSGGTPDRKGGEQK